MRRLPLQDVRGLTLQRVVPVHLQIVLRATEYLWRGQRDTRRSGREAAVDREEDDEEGEGRMDE